MPAVSLSNGLPAFSVACKPTGTEAFHTSAGMPLSGIHEGRVTMHRTLVFGLATVVCAALGAATYAADGITLVENGRAKAVIVLPKDASPSMKWAAEELQTAIEEISGATLPIKNLPGPDVNTPRVVIHMAEHVAAKEASEKSVG